MMRSKIQAHPAQWMGLKALRRGLGVGGRKRIKAKEKGTVPAPADLHPPLDKKRWE
jgi:hypothetical protein